MAGGSARGLRQIVGALVRGAEEISANFAHEAPALVEVEAQAGTGDPHSGEGIALLEARADAGARISAEVDRLAVDLRYPGATEQEGLEVHPQLGGEIELAVDGRHAGHREAAEAELVVVPELVTGLSRGARAQIGAHVARQRGDPGAVEERFGAEVEPLVRVITERDQTSELIDQGVVQRDGEGGSRFPTAGHRMELP